jgi:hypothetical protein
MSIPETKFSPKKNVEGNSKSWSLGLTKNSNAKFGIVITFALNSEQKFHYMKPADVPRKRVDHAGMHSLIDFDCHN